MAAAVKPRDILEFIADKGATQISTSAVRDIREGGELIQTALRQLGWTGTWKLKTIGQARNQEHRRVLVSRMEHDGLKVKTKPGDNGSCWEHLLKAPLGTSPRVLEFLRDDLRELSRDGVVAAKNHRTPKELQALLTGAGVSAEFAEVVTAEEEPQVESFSGSLTRVPTPLPTAPQQTKGPRQAAPVNSITDQLLDRLIALREFRHDQARIPHLNGERGVYVGQLEEAKREVARLEQGIRVIDETIAEIRQKWPHPEALVEEEHKLKLLAGELSGLLSADPKEPKHE